MNNLTITLREEITTLKEEMQQEYNEYSNMYNQLAVKLEELGANNEIFQQLSLLCCKALNINLDIMCYKE